MRADRCEHLLEACRAYKASITPSAPRGALSALGGVLAVLQAGGDTQDTVTRAADVPEARLATALERLTDESDAGVPLGHEGLAAPLAASLGAPLLSPLAEALRAVGARRAEHATQLQAALVEPVQAFLQTSLRGVEAARYTYGRRSRDADIAREAFLRTGGSDPRARAAAAEAHADASLARDAARAALAAAVCHAEGARRHAVLSAAVAALQAMREHALSVMAEVDSFTPAMEAAQAYAAQAAAQAEKRAAAQSEANEAFMTARQAETEAAKLTPDPSRAPMPNDGRSDAGAALRQSMASHREASPADAEPPPLKESYLMLRAAGGWHRRYFALTAGGTLAFHRTRAGALAAVHGAVVAGSTSKKKQQQLAVLPATAEDEAAAHDSEAASGDEQEDDDDATALARAAIGSMWSMGSSLLRGAVSGAVSGARSLAETAGELATAAGQRVTAPSSGAITLLTASIKMGAPETDAALAQLPFIFRVMTPVAGGSLILQAESAAERAAWVAVLQGVVAELLTGSGRRDSTPAWASLRAAPGNSACADCGAADPDWASLNLCVVLCQHCAGAHRRLGAAASAVRSLTLDEDAWTPTVVALFAAHGNTAANSVYAALQDGEELRPDSPMEARLEVVRAKYVDRQYVDPSVTEAAAQPGALSSAAAASDVAAVLRLLAAGADPNAAAGSLPSPLAAAAAAGSLLAAQALLLNGADACAVGADAATPADLAASSGADSAAALQSLLQAAAARRAHGRTLISASAKASEAAGQHAPPPQEQLLVPPEPVPTEPLPAVAPTPAVTAAPVSPPPVEPPVAGHAVGADEAESPAEKPTSERPPPPEGAQPRTPVAPADDDDGWLDDAVAAPTPGGSKTEVDEDWVE